jgi:precorrin-2/cobalt-factor-2 C20-methyltransferase
VTTEASTDTRGTDTRLERDEMTGTLVGVGVGPGDPAHITVGAVAALRAANRVVAPVSGIDVVGRAESIVRQAVPDVVVERIPFAMAAGASAANAAEAAAVLVPWLDAGERVAFITLGDPNVYSTFSSVAAAVVALRRSVRVETIPGIMAFQDLAARAGTVLLDDRQTLTVVTALDGAADAAAALADHQRAVVIYKGGRHLPALATALEASGRLDGAVFGELLGLPGERIAAVSAVRDQPASYLATIVVPPS